METVFHPSDFSAGDEGAFAHALKLAWAAKAEISLLHVGQRGDEVHWSDFPHARPLLERWGLLRCGASHQDVAKTGLRVKKVKTLGKEPVAAILKHLEINPVDLLVVSTHQRQGLDRWLHHSVAEPMARKARAMTLLVPRHASGFVSLTDGSISLKRILLPVVLSPNADRAIAGALTLATLLSCDQLDFNFLHVGEQSTFPTIENFDQSGWTVTRTLRHGNVVTEILKIATQESPDLIVMASKGHDSFIDALRGSTTEQVLRRAPCPLLVVPAD
jgi:nucleotide-binding universal stress UspA family protein